MRGAMVVLGALLAAACGRPDATELSQESLSELRAAVGEEFTLAPGQRVEIEATDLALRFVGVTEDSRCPVDVACIWAGDVAVVIETTFGAHQRLWKLHCPTGFVGPGSVEVGEHVVRLVGVAPAPVSTEMILPEAYRASFRVE